MTTTPRLWIGTSGWVYKHWMGIFYPDQMPGEQQLPFYAERFDTVEINYSFYHLPERSVFEYWREQVPDGFLFAVKGSRYLTHMKKLKEPEEPLHRLMERATGLGEKLGPILFQFPHTWKLNLDRLHAFVDSLEQYRGVRVAFEFRHCSWLMPEVHALLEKADAGLCLPVHPQMPVSIRLTTSWTYIRFHTGQYGTGFTDSELEPWAERVRAYLADGIDAYVYFNNDPGGHALDDGMRFRAMLR